VFSKDKGKLYPLGQFKLAEMQFMNGNYKQAIRNFKKFKRKKKNSVDDSFYSLAEQWVVSATYALNAKNSILKSKLSESIEKINSSELQFSPYKHGDHLYYTAYSENTDFLELKEIYVTDSIVGEVGTVAILGLNPELEAGNLTFKNEKEVYFSVCKGDTCDIFYGEFNAGVISGIAKQRLFKNQTYVTQPHVVSKGDDTYLFFVSNTDGGLGGMDIWYSKSLGDGWQTPVNLGAQINTPGNELTPFYHGNKLFFGSNWHQGFGGYDIVFSEGWLGKWNEVKNPGAPINSSYHDLYYSFNTTDKKGWFSSNRPEDGNFSTCCSKIFGFEYPDSLDVIERNYKDLEELNRYLPVTLYFHNDEPNPRTTQITTEFNYLTTYKEYLELIPKYKKENSHGLKGDKKSDAELDVEEFFELLVQKGVSDLGIFTDLLLKELASGISVELEIKGYASPRAKSDYNENLSRRRINSLINYLNEYNGGVFRPYLKKKAFNGAELTVVENPFGEEAAADNVSDNLANEKESIYSRGARLERKIEIRSVSFKAEEARSNESLIEMGDIKEGSTVENSYTLSNPTDSTIYLDSIISQCGCTVPELSQEFIKVGESIEIKIIFDSTDKKGFQTKSIVVYSSSFTEPKILTVRGFVY